MGIYLGGSIYNDSQVTEEMVEELIEKNGKGIFLAEYNVTSYSDILAAYNDGNLLITKFSSDGYTVYAPLTFKGSDPFYFEVVNRNTTNDKFVIAIGSSNEWMMSHAALVTVDAYLDSTSNNPVRNKAIAAELTEINNKITGDLNEIFLALASKGVTVPAGAGLDDVAGLITDIPVGGGVQTLPAGYERVTGIKGQWNSSGNPFCFDNLLDTTNQNLISITNVYIEPIPLSPYAHNDHRETQIVCPFADVYFGFYELDGETRLVIHGTNGGDNYNTVFYPTGLNAFGGYKQIIFQNSTLIMDGGTYNLDSRCFAQTTIRNLNSLFGKWSSSDTNTDITIYECTVKQDDKILAHFIPVKNSSTGVPHFFDEISGRLSTTASSDSTMISAFTIIP